MDRKYRRRRSTVAALGLTAIALLGACGDTKEEAGPTTVAREEASNAYVAAGNELCDRTAEEIQTALPDFEGEPTIAQVQQVGGDLSPVLARFRAGVADLDPPAVSQSKHQALLDALDSSIAKLDAAASSEEGAQALLEAGGPPLDEPGNAAHALFERCPAGN